MTSEELARALVAHPELWRHNPRPGRPPTQCDYNDRLGYCCRKTIGHTGRHHSPASLFGDSFDLADMAMAGVLLGMLPMRQRAGGDDDGCWPHGRHWRVRFDGRLYAGATLGEAVAKALLACWGPA